MAPLAANVSRSCRTREPKLFGLAVLADAIVYDGAMVAVDADGLAQPAADTAGLLVQGCAQRGFDNTDGLDGTLGATGNARYCTVDQGEYSYATTGTPVAGALAYVVDDNTVGSATGTNSIVAGVFTEPDPRASGNWFVDHSRKTA